MRTLRVTLYSHNTRGPHTIAIQSPAVLEKARDARWPNTARCALAAGGSTWECFFVQSPVNVKIAMSPSLSLSTHHCWSACTPHQALDDGRNHQGFSYRSAPGTSSCCHRTRACAVHHGRCTRGSSLRNTSGRQQLPAFDSQTSQMPEFLHLSHQSAP